MRPGSEDRATDLINRWAKATDTPAPELSTRPAALSLGPLVGFAALVLIAVLAFRALPALPQGASRSPSVAAVPATSALEQSPSSTATESSEGASPSGSPSPTRSVVGDESATALSVAKRYESARAGGDWQKAWAILSDFSRNFIGSLADYERLERAYNRAGGTMFKLQEPTQDSDLLGPDFLGQPYLDAQSHADITRAWLVFADHPDVRGASAGSVGLLVAPIDDHWYVWIAH